MIGGGLKGSDALLLHVADEIHEVAAIRLDGVVGQQRVADPRHQRLRPCPIRRRLAARARDRKASTLSAAGASPSRKSLVSGTRVGAARLGRGEGREVGVGVICIVICSFFCRARRNYCIVAAVLSHGLTTMAPAASKCAVLRVATWRPWRIAVAAISPSATGTFSPFFWAWR